MILYSQFSIPGHTQPLTPAPSWMRIDNFVDFVLPSRSGLFSRLAALFRRRCSI